MLKELIKAQTEAAKRAEEEKKELFQYLRESDNRTQELVLDAIRELGTILKKWKLDLSFSLFTRFSFFVLLLLFFTITVAVTALLRAFEQFANGVSQLIFSD